MTGKELLFKALRGETTPRPAWVPFVGVHGGSLIDKAAGEYLQSSDLLVQGQSEAVRRYQADGIPVAFDLQLEAEVLGCDLHWADEGPPSVSSHPLEMGRTLDELPAFDTARGRFPVILDAARRLHETVGDDTALYGLICGPFTLAMHLWGNSLFLEMFDNEEGVKNVLQTCADIGKQVADAYIENGCDVIAVVDPMTSQISPEHFRQFVSTCVNDIFDHVRARDAFSSLFVCGDATRNLHAMCETRCDNISIDENIALDQFVELARDNGKSVGGNIRLTVALLMGSDDDCRRDALRCMDACGTTGFVLAPGCDLPYSVPPENLEAVAEVVHDEYKREVARTLKKSEPQDTFDDIPVPDYERESSVIIDVITLDSSTCAPCQYMVDAVEKAVAECGENVIHREHKIATRDGLAYMTKLGVEHVPTICIDGKTAFSSIIPDRDTLLKAIREAEKAHDKTATL